MKTINKRKSLREIILSDENIYNAIYSLQSYIFEKGLLEPDDLTLYYKLLDKFDSHTIHEVMLQCRTQLNKVLGKDDYLFPIRVFFKTKKWEDKKFVFRPIHTASLIDQISMVCLLRPLMFDDTSGKRKKSELTKLIPHHFYGNIPSTKVETLFEPWKANYKRYTDDIDSHCRTYQRTHRYQTEVSLDIKDFFPSISPDFIYDFILKKLCNLFPSKADSKTLKLVLTKLLVFETDLNEKVIDEYYGENVVVSDSGIYLNRGIPQGLPQSYFFGNLCMIEIEKILNRKDLFEGDSYFYVDDSVIYVEDKMDEYSFKEKLRKLNEEVAALNKNITHRLFEKEKNEKGSSKQEAYRRFLNKLDYKIEFHTEGKSDFSPLDQTDIGLSDYDGLLRQTSMANMINSNLDEMEDTYTKDKLEKIIEVIKDELGRMEGKSSHASRVKMLKRLKRFYLFRYKLLDVRLNDKEPDELAKQYLEHFSVDKRRMSIEKKEKWMESFEEDVFQSEGRLLIQILPMKEAEEFKEQLVHFELDFLGKNAMKHRLFFSHDFENAFLMKNLEIRKYDSLKQMMHSNFRYLLNVSSGKLYDGFKKLLPELDSSSFLEDKFIFNNSDEFKRLILNAFYSEAIGVQTSDSLTFIKETVRPLKYMELRILAMLRNKSFNMKAFQSFLADLDPSDMDNKRSVDMDLLTVIGQFITKVRDPLLVDQLIVTHRIVKGIWNNGSKFMNHYTLHNEEHAINLVYQVVRLTKAIDYLSIKQEDYYILFLACYLHDISMVIHPDPYSFCEGDDYSLKLITSFRNDLQDKESELRKALNDNHRLGKYLIQRFNDVFGYFENRVRSKHPEESAEIIRRWKDSNLKYLNPAILEEVAKVSESHGWDSKEVYGLRSRARKSLLSEKYMMMLIRLADLLDVAFDRINYNQLRQNVLYMNNVSQFHWISHLVTEKIDIQPCYDWVKSKSLKKSVIEYLNFNLYLNVKYDSSVSPYDQCKKCFRKKLPENNITLELDKDYKDKHVSLISFNFDGAGHTPKGTCPFICKWTMAKHYWLTNELKELQRYLNRVNSSMIKSVVRLNIIYRDEYPLDADLFDDVKKFLGE